MTPKIGPEVLEALPEGDDLGLKLMYQDMLNEVRGRANAMVTYSNDPAQRELANGALSFLEALQTRYPDEQILNQYRGQFQLFVQKCVEADNPRRRAA